MAAYLVLLAVVVCFVVGAWRGAPYLPARRRDIEEMLDAAELGPGKTLLDLGSGDGALLKAAAKRGIRGYGYEINPLVYAVSLINCWRCRRLVTIRLGDYWLAEWPRVDVVYVFLIKRYMPVLDRELRRRIKTPTLVVSYVFDIPGREHVKSTKNAKIYRYPR